MEDRIEKIIEEIWEWSEEDIKELISQLEDVLTEIEEDAQRLS